MNNLIFLFKQDVVLLIDKLSNLNAIENFNKDNISIDYSSKSRLADLSTNIYLILKKKILLKNFELKKYIYDYFNELHYLEKVEISDIGFINLTVKKKFLIKCLNDLFSNKNRITTRKENINIEFVSANPTGPIHVAHMRGAVLGDVLASMFESVGHNVTREYYVNDAGSQIKTLGISLFKRYKELFNIPIVIEDGEYPGNYLIEIAHLIKKEFHDKWLNNTNPHDVEIFFEKFATLLIPSF